MKDLDPLAERWPQLSALLDEALALPAGERAAWLKALPPQSAHLRDSLRTLLASQAAVETGDFLRTLPKFVPADAATSADAKPGDLVGPYRLLKPLGRGGMGDVWLAERADGELKRPVALKLPRVAWGGAFAERLRRERDILATLAHPHIARLYDAGVDRHGRPYLALEYVEGQPIDAYCRDRRLLLGARLDLLLQAAAAVAHAHSRLVVHRDLKPSNILVTAEGEVRLLDFGIAKLMQDDRTAETRLTEVSGRLLTLDYASPEQIRGEPLGTASDVYSLAVVAYELLTGVRPYRLKRGSAAELEEAIASVDAPLASASATDPAVRRQLRGDLDAVLHQALRKDPARRYASVTAFADDIQRHLAGHAVRALPDRGVYRVRKLLRRHGLAIGVAAAVMAALAVGLAVALWQANEARLQAERAQRSADRESAVSALYLETLTTVAGWDAATFARPNAVPRAMAEQLAALEKRYAAPHQQTALLDVATTQLAYMGDLAGSLAHGERLIRTLERTQASPEALLNARNQVARTLRFAQRHAEAEAALRLALAAPGVASVPEAAQASAWAGLGTALHFQGKAKEAREALNEALRLLERQPDPKVQAQTLQTLSETYRGLDSAAALRASQQAHEALLKVPALEPAYLGASHLYVAAAAANDGRAAQAEAALREALSHFAPLYGDTHGDTAKVVSRLGLAIAAQGRCEEARQLLSARAAAIAARPGPETPAAAQTVQTRQLEMELVCGNVQAAKAFAALTGAAAESLANAPLDVVVAEVFFGAVSGDARAAAALATRRLDSMRPEQRTGGLALRLRLAQAEAQWAAGEQEAAWRTLDDLLASMKREDATGNWTYQHATESAALAAAATGRHAQARALLDALDARPAARTSRPFTFADRLDSALRRAQVWQAAGQADRARALLATVEADLALQHPASPRVALARSLQRRA